MDRPDQHHSQDAVIDSVLWTGRQEHRATNQQVLVFTLPDRDRPHTNISQWAFRRQCLSYKHLVTCRVGTVTDVFGEGAFAVSTKDPSHKYENRLTAFTKEGVSYYGPYIAINGTKHVMRSYNQAMAFHELVEALEPMRRILRNMAEGMNRVSEIATLFSSKHQGKTNAK